MDYGGLICEDGQIGMPHGHHAYFSVQWEIYLHHFAHAFLCIVDLDRTYHTCGQDMMSRLTKLSAKTSYKAW
jgi:hypothetical protein